MNEKIFKTTLVAAVSLMCFVGTNARAAISDSKVIVDGRVDYLSQSYTVDGGSQPSNAALRINSFRADFQGKIGEETSYRFRMTFPNNSAVPGYPGPADNLSTFFDYAYVSRVLAENLTLVMGKQFTGAGGWYATTDIPDIYYFSKAAVENIGLGLIYMTGVQLKYEASGQKINLLVTDSSAGSTDSGTSTGNANNARQGVGLRYYGSLMDSTLKPTVGYFTENLQNQSSSPKNLLYSFTNLGLKYLVPGKLVADLDYLMSTFADRTSVGNSDSTNEFDLKVTYTVGETGLKPFAMYSNTIQKFVSAASEKKVANNAFILGAEYYPKNGEDFRYHLVYTNQTTNTDLGLGAASTNLNQQQIIAGVRFSSDMLK